MKKLEKNLNLEKGIVIKVNNQYLTIQIGHDNIECPDADSYLDYTLYNEAYEDIDGGQIDYNSKEIDYAAEPENAIEEILNDFGFSINEIEIMSEENTEEFFDYIDCW